MNFLSFLILENLIGQISQQSSAAENIFETPKIVSFTVSQNSIEIAQSNAELNFNLKLIKFYASFKSFAIEQAFASVFL